MAFLNDEAFDQGLDWVDTNGTRLDICSQEPATYAEATSTYTLGNATVNTGVAQDNSTNGRKVIVPAVSGMSVTGTGTATHWALSNGSDTLVATGSLSASQSVTSGNTIDTAAFDIIIEDAVSA
jgi:hypothetical protein